MVAIIDDDGAELGHAGLHAKARERAEELRQKGVKAGDRVAMVAHGESEVFVVMEACARIGAAFVPLSWRASAREIEEIVADCAPRVVIGADVPDGHGHGHGGTQRRIGHGHGTWQILYTSGTTGRPKGVLISRRQVAFNAAATIRLCGLRPTDRVLGLLPLFHTGGLNALATPVLAAGGAVVLMRRFDAERAVAKMKPDRISAIIAVPTIYEQLLDAGLSRETAPRLRVLLVGGAPPGPRLLDRYRAAGLRLRQGFGMTEAGPNCFAFGEDGSVGRPVDGTEARLVGGELHLRGPHVCDGYLGLGPATDADGWLATGDLFRIDDAGNYHVIGRKKEMFISGGENIYPAEIERVLAEHPAIADAAVVPVPDPRWGEVGLAAVVARAPVEAQALERWTRARLAAFKVPRHWRFVAELPRTASGKLARARLAELLAS